MPEARLSKAPAVPYREIQLDIWNKLSEHIVHIDEVVGSGVEKEKPPARNEQMACIESEDSLI